MKIRITESQYNILVNKPRDVVFGRINESKTTQFDKDTLRKIALQYDTRKKFELGRQGAYKYAIRLGPCYDKTTGEEKPCQYYDKEKRWRVSTPNVVNSFGFLNSICSHMKPGGLYGDKFVYSYTFFDDKNTVVGIYVGITNDEERRKNEHLGSGIYKTVTSVGKFLSENPNFTFKYKKLTNIISYELAKWYEEYYVKKYRSKGYNILNISKTGSGGKTFIPNNYHIDKAQKWVKMKLENGEIPYVGDYLEFDSTNYKAILSKKIQGDAMKGMVYKDRKKYSDEYIFNTAMSFDSYNDFVEKHKGNVVQQAKRRGLLPKIEQMFNDKNNEQLP